VSEVFTGDGFYYIAEDRDGNEEACHLEENNLLKCHIQKGRGILK